MSVILDGTAGLTFNDASTQNTAATGFGFKSRIINGAMVIDQRNSGAASANTINAYFLDRWAVFQSTSGKLIAQQNAGAVTPPAGFTHYLGVTSQSAFSVASSDYYIIAQGIEGFNFADLAWGTANAATVTLSFWVRSSLTGTFGGTLRNGDVNYSYPFTYTINAANTWEYKTITIAGPTAGTWIGATNALAMQINFGLGVGSTLSGTAGSWASANYLSATGATSVVGTNGATFYITGVQLEKGSTATSFDYRPYGTELALCQRYFERLPAGPSGYVSIRTNAWYGYIHWQVEKRASATAVLTGTLGFVGTAGDVLAQTPVGIDQLSTKACRVYLQTGSYTAQGAFIYIDNNLAVSSEL